MKMCLDVYLTTLALTYGREWLYYKGKKEKQKLSPDNKNL